MTILHVKDPVRIFVDARIMGDNQDAALFIENFLFHKGDDHPASVAIQRGGRFVKNQNLRLADDRPRNRHALLLAAGKLHRQNVAPVFKTDNFQLFSRLADGFIPVALLQNQRNRDILGRGQPWKQMVILKDEANRVQPEIRQLVIVQRPNIGSLHFHVAGVGPQDAGNHAEHGRLAAAGGADDEQHLAKVRDQSNLIHRRHLGLACAKPFGQTGGNDCLMILWGYGVGGHSNV